jgi:hypothetical protein
MKDLLQSSKQRNTMSAFSAAMTTYNGLMLTSLGYMASGPVGSQHSI